MASYTIEQFVAAFVDQSSPAAGWWLKVAANGSGTADNPLVSNAPTGLAINVSIVSGGVGDGFLKVAGGVALTTSLQNITDNATSANTSILYLSTTNLEIRGTGISTFSLYNGTKKVSFDYSGITGTDKVLTIPNTTGTIALTSDLPTTTGLLKTTLVMSGSLQVVKDYAGTSSILQLSTAAVALTGFTTGSIPFIGASSAITQNNPKIFWDNTSFFLGLGTATPTSELYVYSTSTASDRGISFQQDSADALGARINTIKSRSNGIITTADVIGRWAGWGFDGTGSKILMAQISMNSTGTIASTRVPTTITFSTATNATPSVLTLALTLGSDQTALFASSVTASGGFKTDTDYRNVTASGSLDLRNGASGVAMNTYRFNNLANATHTSGTYNLISNANSDFIPSAAGSGNFRLLNLAYTLNGTAGVQTGTATCIMVNTTETTLNGLAHNFFDFQVSSVSKGKLTSAGALTLVSTCDASAYKVGGVAGFTGTGTYVTLTINGGIITNAV